MFRTEQVLSGGRTSEPRVPRAKGVISELIPDERWYPKHGEGMPWSISPLRSVALLVNTSTVCFGVHFAELSRIQSRLLSTVGFCSLISKSKNSHLGASGELPAEVLCAVGLGELPHPTAVVVLGLNQPQPRSSPARSQVRGSGPPQATRASGLCRRATKQ